MKISFTKTTIYHSYKQDNTEFLSDSIVFCFNFFKAGAGKPSQQNRSVRICMLYKNKNGAQKSISEL